MYSPSPVLMIKDPLEFVWWLQEGIHSLSRLLRMGVYAHFLLRERRTPSISKLRGHWNARVNSWTNPILQTLNRQSPTEFRTP